ncbi:MAG: hypothetical protein P9L92_05675 [Candidatus Electryonea clarkiae]|nr:hypothetical protein [Candidatus Electryonea clarkiae]MDP8289325.1 hypothetical protein [Candidatus Electryonea clarkiae]
MSQSGHFKLLGVISIISMMIAFFFGCSKQNITSTDPCLWIAIAESDTITVEEFKNRYSFTPHIGKGSEAKILFLKALVIERLLAQYASESKTDKKTNCKILLQQFADEAVVEGLLTNAIKARVSISDAEIREHYSRYSRRLNINAWVFSDSITAYKAFERYNGGQNFRDLSLSETGNSNTKYYENQNLIYNQTEENLEKTAYNLLPDQAGEPVQVNNEWWLLKLNSSETTEMKNEQNFHAKSEYLRNVIYKRKSYSKQKTYIAEVMKGRSIKIDPGGFDWLVDHLLQILPGEQNDEGISLPLIATPQVQFDPELVEMNEKDKLDLPLITLDGSKKESWSRREVLEKLYSMPRTLNPADRKIFAQNLYQALLWLVEFSALAEQGLEQGIDNEPEVVEEIEIWQQHVRAQFGLEALMADRGITMSADGIDQLVDSTRLSRQDDIMEEWLAETFSKKKIQYNLKQLTDLELPDSPALIRKTHFPNRPILPIPIGYRWTPYLTTE